MPLRLLVGPVRSGKLGAVLERFEQAIANGQRPSLLVPAASERDELEREICERAGALIGGEVVTLDELARRIGGVRRDDRDAVRARAVRQRVAVAAGSRPRAIYSALESLDAELERGGVDRAEIERAVREGALDAGLAGAYDSFVEALAAEGIAPAGAPLAAATRRLERELAAWDGRPVIAYGFDDLSPAQLAFLQALELRCELVLALPYEPGRAAFAALSASVEPLLVRAEGAIEEHRASAAYGAPDSLVALARGLFSDRDHAALGESDGGVRLLEAVSTDGEARAVIGAASAMLKRGIPAEQIVVVVPGSGTRAGRLASALEAASIPVVHDRIEPFAAVPFGGALLALCRYAWHGGDRDDLFRWLRSPASGLARPFVDDCEARLRMRGEQRPHEILGVLQAEPKGRRLGDLDTLRAAESPLEALRVVLEGCAPRLFGLAAERVADPAAHRAWDAAIGVLDALSMLGRKADRDELETALERARVRVAGGDRSGAVSIVELGRARLRTMAGVIVTGLEEGGVPRRDRPPALVPTTLRQATQEERDRFLFSALVARTDDQLVLVRQISDAQGRELAPSPFWLEVLRVLGEAAPAPELVRETAHEPADALTPRERLRAIAGLEALDAERFAALLAGAGADERDRLARARAAWKRSTRIERPELLARHADRSFSATELESFARCSARWLVEREIRPKPIDGGIDIDVRQRGIVGHDVLKHFFKGLPAVIGRERLEPADLPLVRGHLNGCIERSIETNLRGSDPDGLGWVLLRRQLERDLWGLVERESERTDDFDVRSYEVSIPEPGLDLGGAMMKGRIDRIDRQQWVAHAVVRDYKSSQPPALGESIVSKGFLQIPLYIRAVRELMGYEAVGGVYQSLRGGGDPRGMLRLDAREEGLSGFVEHDYLTDELFEQVLDDAVSAARSAAERIRVGDVRHDPSDGDRGACPAWCAMGPICRVERS